MSRRGSASKGVRRVAVRVSTPSRLHFGLIPVPCRGLGRYAGVGLALRRPRVVVEAQYASQVEVTGPQRDRVLRVLEHVTRRLRFPDRPGVAIRVVAAPPAHHGLGSGTQLTLATAAAIHRLSGVPFDPWDAARALGRGRRSAIGAAAFQRGGFLIDYGRSSSGCGSDQVRRFDWPGKWRFVVVRLTPLVQVCGAVEEAVFSRADSLFADLGVADEMARLLVEALPVAVVNRDFVQFARVVGTYGKLAGRCFERYQGGIYAHPVAERVAAFAERHWRLPALQSSWGPTIAIPVASPECAKRIRTRLAIEFGDKVEEIFVSGVASRGAIVATLQGARL